MASGQLVPKKVLIEQIRRTVIDGESGVFTVLTGKKRSIMLRFSEGKLIYSHCRSRNVEDAIAALNECDELKFSHSASQPKEQPELMTAEAFMLAISPDEVVDKPPVGRKLLEPVNTETETDIPDQAANPALEGQVRDIARDYIGMVSNMLVADVFAKRLPVDKTIAEIAASIPIADHAKAFRRRVEALDWEPKAEDVETVVKKDETEHRLFF